MDCRIPALGFVCTWFHNENIFDSADANLKQSADFQFQAGLDFQKKGNYRRAMKCFRECILKQKNHTEAHYNLALCLYQRGQVASAKECFEKVVNLNLNHFLAHHYLGEIYFYQQHDTENSLKHLEIASRLNPNKVDTWILLGLVYRDRKDFQQALRANLQAIKKTLLIKLPAITLETRITTCTWRMRQFHVLLQQ